MALARTIGELPKQPGVMAKERSHYLINQLIGSKLSGREFDEFLAGLHRAEDAQAYSDAMQAHFDALLNEPNNLSESEETTESHRKESKPDF